MGKRLPRVPCRGIFQGFVTPRNERATEAAGPSRFRRREDATSTNPRLSHAASVDCGRIAEWIRIEDDEVRQLPRFQCPLLMFFERSVRASRGVGSERFL